MFDKKSDYAKNKRNADSIIYTDANEEEIRLTRDDFESEEEFRKWKVWSDGQYHETEKSGRSYQDHKLPLFDEEGTYGDAMEEWLNRLDEESRYDELLDLCQKLMTKTQLRRFWLYAVKKMSEQKIAELEGVSQQRISDSIRKTRRKIVNFLKTQKKGL